MKGICPTPLSIRLIQLSEFEELVKIEVSTILHKLLRPSQ
ncbi:hypothetical protein AM1_D0170 (plasmid) [Acaryochloris marina MBIC11017]|uniref:Uncharacterized protein n=1 Tax=Acaryochloris marina (strain MBIC 11017) TaxID=329726 RepID=A8ZNS9_ACAM1|nr:hypothetical protein AM1_D0170 [Acaryochloris marina MBIC11017]